MSIIKTKARDRKRKKIRAKISGTSTRPRLSVFKSNTALYAQLIDDVAGKTLASAKGVEATKVGASIAEAAGAKGISTVVFDRGGYVYTGKIKMIAEAARAKGLKF